jgi:hypothetical protein
MDNSLAPVVLGGNARHQHEANIMSAANRWQGYDRLHANALAEAGRKPYLLVNAEGTTLQRAADPRQLQGNATTTVRHEDFQELEQEILRLRRRELNGIADLQAANLTRPASVTDQLVGYEAVGAFDAAKQEMNPTNKSVQNNGQNYKADWVPLPITHSGFSVPWRQTGFSYKGADGIAEGVRQCEERLEETLFNGNSAIAVTFSGTQNVIYGYTTHPNRGTGTISDWSLAANVESIVPELNTQLGLMRSSQGGIRPNSITVYVANDIWQNLQNDYKTANPTSKTVHERMMAISEVGAVKPAEKLASTQVVLVEMDRRSVILHSASDIIAVPHLKTSPMQPQDFTVYAAQVHQIKVDRNNNTGVRHLTT